MIFFTFLLFDKQLGKILTEVSTSTYITEYLSKTESFKQIKMVENLVTQSL